MGFFLTGASFQVQNKIIIQSSQFKIMMTLFANLKRKSFDRTRAQPNLQACV